MKRLVILLAALSAAPSIFADGVSVIEPSISINPNGQVLAGSSEVALPVGSYSGLFSIATLAQAEAPATDAQVIPATLLNNEFYRESLRLKALSDEAFENGDYDSSATYAADAAAAAQKSDDYVALRLRMKEVDDAIFAANTRLAWARSIGAEKTWADRVTTAQTAYDAALAQRAATEWDNALASAKAALAALADVRDVVPLPARYTVRSWAEARDCFWNIAGYSFVYNDPTKWQLLYNANKAKLRQPSNPNLLHPGTILTIPSIRGEFRSGDWVKGTVYEPLKRK